MGKYLALGHGAWTSLRLVRTMTLSQIFFHPALPVSKYILSIITSLDSVLNFSLTLGGSSNILNTRKSVSS